VELTVWVVELPVWVVELPAQAIFPRPSLTLNHLVKTVKKGRSTMGGNEPSPSLRRPFRVFFILVIYVVPEY
jgi:hypothetical protein